MTRSVRDQLIRKYDQAYNNLERCESCLKYMYGEYHPDYPERAATVLQLAGLIVDIRTLLALFRTEQM